MLRLQDVSLMRGVRVLYSHATLLANPGERVGLVGENGCGKSSLLAAILGEIPIEAGEISAPDFQHIGHVAQDIDTVDEVAIDWVLSGHAPWQRGECSSAESVPISLPSGTCMDGNSTSCSKIGTIPTCGSRHHTWGCCRSRSHYKNMLAERYSACIPNNNMVHWCHPPAGPQDAGKAFSPFCMA